MAIWNTSFGPPVAPELFLATQLLLTSFIGMITITLARKTLRLSKVPLSLLWVVYYAIGLAFHLSGWLSGDAASYGFLGPTAIHVYIEGLLCIKSLSVEGDLDWWGRAWSMYYCIATFVAMCLWQPLNVFVFGSVLALPADSLTIPAALAVMARSVRWSRTWWLGFTWMWNGPIVAYIFFVLIWAAKKGNNMAGGGTLLLQVQYIALGICVIAVFGKMVPQEHVGSSQEANQCIELGILPTKDEESAKKKKTTKSGLPEWMIVGDMKRGLKLTVVLVGIQFVVSVLLPLAAGRIDLDMFFTNVCNSFLPGAVNCDVTSDRK